VLTEGDGIPVGLTVAGANVNDFKLARDTIESIPLDRPKPTRKKPQGLCLDKGYDYDEVRALARSSAIRRTFAVAARRRNGSNAIRAAKLAVGSSNAPIVGSIDFVES